MIVFLYKDEKKLSGCSLKPCIVNRFCAIMNVDIPNDDVSAAFGTFPLRTREAGSALR